MASKTVYSCDLCHEEIKDGEIQVFAGTFGLDFHLDCLEKANGTIIGLFSDEVHAGISSTFKERPNHAPRILWDRKKVRQSDEDEGEWARPTI